MAIRSPKWLAIAALVTLAPDTPGVIELWDGDEVLYVGAARRLRGELIQRLLEADIDATHFAWEISFDPETRKRELLAELERQPPLNS